jgi:uncharacterized membrane protein
MTWIYLLINITSGTIGDLLTAKGMAQGGELNDFGPHGLLRLIRYIFTYRLVLIGTISNALCFFSFMALLSVAEVSFVVPVTALGYVLKAFLAKWCLGECVTWRRWMGACWVTLGVSLILF